MSEFLTIEEGTIQDKAIHNACEEIIEYLELKIKSEVRDIIDENKFIEDISDGKEALDFSLKYSILMGFIEFMTKNYDQEKLKDITDLIISDVNEIGYGPHPDEDDEDEDDDYNYNWLSDGKLFLASLLADKKLISKCVDRPPIGYYSEYKLKLSGNGGFSIEPVSYPAKEVK